MTHEILFVSILGAFFAMIYNIAFRVLPDERWQIFAAVPVRKNGDTWDGTNITYYGLLTSTGYTIAFTLFLLMMSSAGAGSRTITAACTGILILFIPAARIMAYIVERKKHTITVGGAVFVMIISAPPVYTMIGAAGFSGIDGNPEEWVFLSSLITAYAFGEGFGRLACISFGCCYGKPVDSLPSPLKTLFSRFNFIYTGRTKKIAYHDRLDGVETVPVQAITAVLYTASGLCSLYLFLSGNFAVSFFLSLSVTQLWRFLSEFLRADFRGGSAITPYQIMSVITIPYYILYAVIRGLSSAPAPLLTRGLDYIWSPGTLFILFLMWVGGVLYTGISSVTSSRITITVNKEKI